MEKLANYFAFITKNVSDLLNFMITLLDSSRNQTFFLSKIMGKKRPAIEKISCRF